MLTVKYNGQYWQVIDYMGNIYFESAEEEACNQFANDMEVFFYEVASKAIGD